MSEKIVLPTDPKFQDLTGQTFGRLTAVRFLRRNRHRQSIWLCRCDCGTETEINSGSMRAGKSRSCGCLKRETNAAHIRHGHKRTGGSSPEYSVWRSMKQRCGVNRPQYRRYHGRGITVCKWWMEFTNWLADIGHRPSTKHSLERPDNDSGYWCGHCDECLSYGRERNGEWATQHVQSRNRSNIHFIEFRGERLCLSDWADRVGIRRGTLSQRIRILGWPTERALTTPVRHQRRRQR